MIRHSIATLLLCLFSCVANAQSLYLTQNPDDPKIIHYFDYDCYISSSRTIDSDYWSWRTYNKTKLDTLCLPLTNYYKVLTINNTVHKALLSKYNIPTNNVVFPGQSRVLRVNLTSQQVIQLISDGSVLYIEPETEVSGDTDLISYINGINYVNALMPIHGENIVGEVVDIGILPTHNAFKSKPPIILGVETGITGYHGTSVYGIIFGSDIPVNYSGLLPQAQGIFALNLTTLDDRWGHVKWLINSFKGVFQTNSWGHVQTTEYTLDSYIIDEILLNENIVITQSQSNLGSRLSRPEAWAKNVISVGGIRHQNDLDVSNDKWNYGASTGPSDDGRVKPDVCGAYDMVWSPSYSDDTDYSEFGGTSASTPIVAATAGAVIQLWTATNEDGKNLWDFVLSGEDSFENRPPHSTVKALLINSANQYPFSGMSHDLGRFKQGWGVPNLYNLLRSADRTQIIPETVKMVAGDKFKIDFESRKTDQELKITLVYTDPPAIPSAEFDIVNVVTLKAKSPSGEIYSGNFGLIDGNYSIPTEYRDTINNVQNIFVKLPEIGTWEITVSADIIRSDAILSDSAKNINFSLIIRPTLCVADLNNDSVVDVKDLTLFAEYSVDRNILADLNQDSLITYTDVLILEQYYRNCRLGPMEPKH